MKVTRDGTKYVVRDIAHELLHDIPGVKQVSETVYTMYRDAYAVLGLRHGKLPALPQRPTFGADAQLRPYQVEGVSFLVDQLKTESGALLADDMGLGKTLQTIRTWQALGKPALLVCCPASVRLTWAKEFKKWADVEAVVVTTGKQAEACGQAPVVVTSYDLATKIDPMFTPQFVVLDEAHLLAGRGAKRSRALLEIARGCNYRLALTGTPLWSRPRDLWMLLRILFPNYRFGSADEFDFAYCGASINKWGGKENKGATRVEELKARLAYVQLRRTKAEVAKDLPALTRTTLWIPATKEASRARDAFALKQMSLHDALAATLKGKMDEAIRLASEFKQFLLFTWQKEHAHALHQRLNDEGTPCEIITGDFSHAQRAATVERARARKVGVVATIDSCGVGVDGLQHVASNGIFHAIDWVPTKTAQAEARLHRIGQTLPITWVYLAMVGSADALVIENVVEKLGQWSAVMGLDSTGEMTKAFTNKDEARLADAALKEIYANL